MPISSIFVDFRVAAGALLRLARRLGAVALPPQTGVVMTQRSEKCSSSLSVVTRYVWMCAMWPVTMYTSSGTATHRRAR